MFRALHDFVDRVTAPLPGWIFLTAGLSLVALAILVPAWTDVREKDWQVGVMRLQAKTLAEQAENYKEFHAALAADDPVLLERLAYYHLRLKPAGTQAVSLMNSTGKGNNEPHVPTVEELLHRPVPTPGENMPAYKPLNTRLIRLTRNNVTRVGLIAAGFLCVIAGLTSVVPRRPNDEDQTTPTRTGLVDETGGQTDNETTEDAVEDDTALAVLDDEQADDEQPAAARVAETAAPQTVVITEAVAQFLATPPAQLLTVDAPARPVDAEDQGEDASDGEEQHSEVGALVYPEVRKHDSGDEVAGPTWRDRIKARVISLPGVGWLRRRGG